MARYTLPLPQSFDEIPVTGQSLAVLLIAYLLGWRDSGIAIVIYLVIGALGLPVFADGASGLEAITGSSGGFLVGFLISAIVTNLLVDNTTADIKEIFQFMIVATIIILVVGGLRLRMFISWEDVWTYGIEPFLPGAMIKLFLATVVAYGVRSYILVPKNKIEPAD
jgi:biotin transport system substrate-specific component